ncbi:hypothetical protein H6F74_05845 [Trichocoleus sp. FACHB-90]|nr:hypothetical protein [Trichocoleus sp. FACHB-90]
MLHKSLSFRLKRSHFAGMNAIATSPPHPKPLYCLSFKLKGVEQFNQ